MFRLDEGGVGDQ